MLRVIKFTTLYLILSFIIGSFFYSEYSYSVGTIKVVKQTDPPGFGGFDFTLDTCPVTEFSLSDGAMNTIVNLAAATYVVTEITIPAGFDLVNISCVIVGGGGSTIDDTDLPNGTVTITLADGDEVTCTYLNLGNGTIRIEKETNPTGGLGFGFTDDIPGGPATFSLDDGQFRVFGNIPSGTYVVTEDDPTILPGEFLLSDIVCNDIGSSTNVNTRTATIDLDPDETITCTFTNTQQLIGLNLIKTDSPDPVVAGDELTYEITITNDSNQEANTVMLNDMLPPGVILVDVFADRGDIVCTSTDSVLVDCDIGILMPNETVKITIIVIPDPNQFPDAPEIVENKATLTAEPGSVVRESITLTQVNPIVTLDVIPNDGQQNVGQGNSFTVAWDITVSPNPFGANLNSAESSSVGAIQKADALNVVLDVFFSDLLVVESVETTQGICTVGSVQCILGNILEGQTVTVIIIFRAPNQRGEFNISANVNSLNQTFTNNVIIFVSGQGNGCSLAAEGATMGFPLLLILPVVIMIRRILKNR